MKSFLKKASVFLLLPVIPLMMIGRYDNLDKTTSDNGSIINLQNIAKFDSLDILFIGNSYCYAGINPAIFDDYNISTYCFGIGTAGPYFYDLVIKDYLLSTKTNPKFIFLMVSPRSFVSSDDFSAYPIHRYLLQPKSNEHILFEYGQIKRYPELVAKSISKGITNLITDKPPNKDFSILKNKGYIPTNEINSDSIVNSLQKFYGAWKTEDFDKEYFDRLEFVAKWLEKENINVVFFETPTNILNDYFSDDYLLEYKNAVTKIKANYFYISNDLELENKYYRDIDHLNSNGATIYSNHLIDRLSGDSRFKSINILISSSGKQVSIN